MMKDNLELDYRPDIDGLRALAVILIVLFHFEIGPFDGGFVAVDVFFVISGFLMTRIVETSLAKGSFSLVNFYSRRIKRIIPALDFVLLLSLIAGYFLILNNEFMELGKSVFQSSLFKINLSLSQQGGYFDKASALKPLLHLWTIAVEVQFYFLWPFVLLILPQKNKLKWVGFITAVFFMYSVYASYNWPDVAYYMLPSRFWTLSLGGFVALLGPNEKRGCLVKLSSTLAISAIVVTILLYAKNDVYPGWRALIPAFAAAVLIFNGKAGAWTKFNILEFKPLPKLGRISYSLYLIHWPVIYFLTMTTLMKVDISYKIAGIAFSVFFAAVNTIFFEDKIRKSKTVPVSLIITIHLAVAGLGIAASKMGNPQKISDLLTINADYKKQTVENCLMPDKVKTQSNWCEADKKFKVNHFVLGDSHASIIFPALVRSSLANESWAIAAKAGCAPQSSHCEGYFMDIARELKSHPEVNEVLIAFSARMMDEASAFYLNEKLAVNHSPRSIVIQKMIELIDLLAVKGRTIKFLTAPPALLKEPQFCLPRPYLLSQRNSPLCSLSVSEANKLMASYDELVKQLKNLRPGIQLINSREVFCRDGQCEVVRKNGISNFSYGDHISEAAALEVAKLIRNN